MCGIVGIIGRKPVADRLVEGIRRLEYRGYDSSGVATVESGVILCRKTAGKIINLENLIDQQPIGGNIGIAHTRWATHGEPTERNAHPHSDDSVAVVHNGIIENFAELKKELLSQGCVFTSETDTEVVVHLISQFLKQGLPPLESCQKAFEKLKGAFALAILFKGHDRMMIGTRRGSPLAVGIGRDEMFLGSDALALIPFTSQVCYLEEGDVVVLEATAYKIFDENGHAVTRAERHVLLDAHTIGKGNYRHHMIKEINEQPGVVSTTFASYVNIEDQGFHFKNLDIDFEGVDKITIVACGTSFYAGQVAKYWFEQVVKIPCDIDIASEFRYRQPPLSNHGVTIIISQSGETADSLAALKYAKQCGQKIVSIVNVPESAIARLSDHVLLTMAGPEIGVASTKAFTCQLTVLFALTLYFAKKKKSLSDDGLFEIVKSFLTLPGKIQEILKNDIHVEDIAAEMADAKTVLYIARGSQFPVALEGALKLKEISYIHAEGFAAGELKHGPIALIDDTVPVVVLAPDDVLFEKLLSNVHEVKARGAKVVLFSDAKGLKKEGHLAFQKMEIPEIHPVIAPILYAIPMQLLAYYVAVLKGTDVDQPRNLAKSVTVE